MYLLDTNICIYIIKKKPVDVLKTLKTSGLKTADLGGTSTTTEFTDKIIENL